MLLLDTDHHNAPSGFAKPGLWRGGHGVAARPAGWPSRPSAPASFYAMDRETFERELQRYGPGGGPAVALDAAREYCRRLAASHYENFSVVTWMVPRPLRQHFCNIYAYCRWSDDLADAVDGRDRRIELLEWWGSELDACYAGEVRHPVFVALADTIQRYSVPRAPFAELLVAMRQDQEQTRYDSFDALLRYCRHSANPVGRLVLVLGGGGDDRQTAWSDAICTGLQLANFCQDTAADYQRGRIYWPRDECQRFGFGEADFAAGRPNAAWRALLRFQVERADGFLAEGEPLARHGPAGLRRQIRLFLEGGRAILRAIERQGYDVWTARPVVGRWTKARLLLGTLLRPAGIAPRATPSRDAARQPSRATRPH